MAPVLRRHRARTKQGMAASWFCSACDAKVRNPLYGSSDPLSAKSTRVIETGTKCQPERRMIMSHAEHRTNSGSAEMYRAECLPLVRRFVDLVEKYKDLPKAATLTEADLTLVMLKRRSSEVGLTVAIDIIQIAQDVLRDLQQNRLLMNDQVHDLLRLAADTTAVLIEGHQTDDAFAAGLGAILRRMRESIHHRRRAA